MREAFLFLCLLAFAVAHLWSMQRNSRLPRPAEQRLPQWRAWVKSGALVVALFLLTACCLLLRYPVWPAMKPGELRDTIYLPWVTRATVEAVVRAYTSLEPPLLIVPRAAAADAELWSRGLVKVEALEGNNSEGLTIAAAIEDLSIRSQVLHGEGKIIFAYPRSRDANADLAMLGDLRNRVSTLNARLYVVWPTDDASAPPLARKLPKPPSVRLQVPQSVSDKQKYVFVDGGVQASPDTRIKVTFETSRTGQSRPTLHQINPSTGDVTIPSAGTRAKPLSLSGGAQGYRAVLDPPKAGEFLLTRVLTTDDYGTTLVAAYGYTGIETPELGVLKLSSSKDRSPLFSLLVQCQLQVREVSLDLDSASLEKINANASILGKWGLILIDTYLSRVQGQNLKTALDAATNPPAICFVGRGPSFDTKQQSYTAGFAPGYLPLHSKFTANANARQIVIMADNSGSLTQRVSGNVGKSGIQARNDLIAKLVEIASDGRATAANIQQYDAGNLLLYLGPDLVASAYKPRSTKLWPLADVPKLVGTTHSVELNPMLIDLYSYAKDKPVSDAIILFDPQDMQGQGIFDGHFDSLRPESATALGNLQQRAVRLHLITLRGELQPHSGLIEGDLLRILRSSTAASDADFEQKMLAMIHGVLPRLAVAPHETGLASLKAQDIAKYDRLKDALARPVLVANSLAPFQKVGSLGTNVLAYLKHWDDKKNEGAPLLLRVEQNLWATGVYWLSLDPQAESYRDAPGMSELIVASINAIATNLKPSALQATIGSDSRVNLQRRDFLPFWLKTGLQTELRTAMGVKVAGEPDTRRLDNLRVSFPGLEAGVANQVTIKFEDADPDLGVQELRLSMLAPPPTLIDDSGLRSLYGHDLAADPAGKQNPATQQSQPPWFERHVMGNIKSILSPRLYAVMLAMALFTLTVWRRL